MSVQGKVEYRQLGKSGLRVSVPIVGAMSFGSKEWLGWVIEEAESLEVLKAAWDLGINTIDTANVYSNGVSEEICAKFIEKYSIPRHRVLILTKCRGLTLRDNVGVRSVEHPGLKDERDNINQSGLSRQAIFNQVDASLARLKTDYIDLLQIHRFDPLVRVEETMKALHDLVQSGKVRYIGASSMRTWQFAMMNEVADKYGWTKFVSMQDEYSLLYREEEREMIPYCKHNGIGLIPWGPLNHGALAKPLTESSARIETSKGTVMEKKWSDADKEINKRVEELAKKKGWSMAQVALTWVRDKVSSPIVGMSSVKRVEECIIPKDKFSLTGEEIKYLEELYVPVPVNGHA